MSSIFFILDFHLTKKNNRAQLFLCNKYTVFTIGGSVPLRSVNKIFSREL